MVKTSIESQVVNLIERIESGQYDQKGLNSILSNLHKKVDVPDLLRENLAEVIVAQFRKDYPRDTNRMIGTPNRENQVKLVTYFDNLQKRFDLTANGHKNNVKVGGNVLSGTAIIYDYISYRNSNTKMIVSFAFRKFDEEMDLDIAVGKSAVGEDSPLNPSFRTFTPDQFEDATSLFETYLTEVLRGNRLKA